MNVEYNNYDEPIYDKNYYKIDKMSNLKTNDIIYIDNTVCKIVGHVGQNYKAGKTGVTKIYFGYINIFNDVKSSVLFRFPERTDILLPIVENINCNLICMTNEYFQVFDEDNNEIIEIKVNKSIDENIINKIKIKINHDNKIDDVNLKIIRFKNLIRVIDII